MDYVRQYLNVGNVIGQGAFGKVLLSSDKSSSARYALKCIHPLLKPQRLANELRHLRDLMGLCNVVQMHTAHFSKGSLFIVMEYLDYDKFVDIVAKLDQDEIKLYIKNLLIALKYVHSKGIMHRDIKPGNFLFNREHKKFLLVDFGLAQSITAKPIFPPRPNLPNTSLNTSSHQMLTPAKTLPGTPTSQNTIQRSLQPWATPPHFINKLDIIKSSTPNIPTKRSMQEGIQTPNDFNLMLKKLRVDENKEPVRLTVGAYESPITHNDSLLKRKCITPNPTVKRRTALPKCDCRGRSRTCNNCLSRPESLAPKSGTPGFKAPEILLRYNHQSTPIDIWSAGVILACLLAGHYPLFRDADDTNSLSEIIALLGSQNVTAAAKALGIRLMVEPEVQPVNLIQLCKRIRQSSGDKNQIDLPDIAFNLLYSMMDPNPRTRITAEAALNHPWLDSMTTTADDEAGIQPTSAQQI